MNLSKPLSHHHIRALLLVCVVLIGTPAYTQNRAAKLTLQIEKATLGQFVKHIENATGFSFVYGEDVQVNHRISIDAKEATIEEILQRVFKDEPVKFEIAGRHILLFKRTLPVKPARRRFTISGYVTDSLSSETLIGANIVETHQTVGTATNPFGFYTLTLPEGEATISFSYLGYETQRHELTLTKDTLLNIGLNAHNLLQEVVITSNKKEAGIQATAMGAHEIPMTQIRNTPTVMGEADLLKTIQLMPGVQAGVEGFSGLYVRGGGPDQNLVLLDGIPVYNADHMMGIFSIFTPENVKNVNLFKSSFPARYGGRLSSIVDVRTNDGDMKRYHGTISLGMLTSKLHFEGPIVKDRTSFLLSARGTYTALFSTMYRDSENAFNYYFYDLNAKVNHKFNDRNRLFLSFYNGQDQFLSEFNTSYKSGESSSEYYTEMTSDDKNTMQWGNTIASARWNHVFNNQLFSNTTIAFNNYQMRMNNQSVESYLSPSQNKGSQYAMDYRSGIRDWSARIDFDYTPSPKHHIKMGGEYLFHTFRPETTGTHVSERNNDETTKDTLYTNSANQTLTGHEISLYAEDNFDITPRLSINAGMHFSFFHTDGKSYFSAQPRLSARYRLNNDFSIKAAYSQMAQYVHLLSSTPLSMPTDLWVPITRNIRPMRAHQYSLGGYYTGIHGWEFSLEGYYKKMKNVLEYQDGVSFFGSSTNWEEKVETGEGRSMGIEVMVQKTTGKTTGWLAYTLAKSDRIFKDGTINNGLRFADKYDRRHNISLSVNHKFSNRIDIGASWIYNSGGTVTLPEQQTVFLNPDGTLEQTNYISRRNNYRLPASHRLNVGINFHKKTKRGMRTWNISVYNAYNAMNPTFVYSDLKNEEWTYYQGNDGMYIGAFRKQKLVIKKMTLLPLIPSVTYTYRF